MARVGGVVHPDETDDAKGHRPHRLQRAKSDAADEKAGAATTLRERIFEMREQDIKRHGFVEAGEPGGFA